MNRVPAVPVESVPYPLPDGLAVLDVREDFEWDAGHVDGSIHIPMMELPGRLGELPDGQTLVVCKVGSRSAQVVGWLAGQGYDVVNLAGGLYSWTAAGRPLVNDSGETPYVA